MKDSGSRQSSRKRKKHKSRVSKHLTLLLILILLLSGGYFLLKKYTEDSHIAAIDDDANNGLEYTIVENNDTIKNLAVIIYKKNVSINDIAETFYKSDVFWPYIYIANKSVIYNPLNIDADIVLRIPNISDKLLNLQDTASVNKAKFLADSILNSVNEPI